MFINGFHCTQIPITVPKPFKLSVAKRIEERQHFDEQRQQRQLDAEEHEKVRKERRRKEEEEELKSYRRSINFKVGGGERVWEGAGLWITSWVGVEGGEGFFGS